MGGMKRLPSALLIIASLLLAACVTTNSPQRHKVYYTVEHILLPSMWFSDRAELEKDFRANGADAILNQFRNPAGEASTALPNNLSAAVEEIDLGNGWSGWLITFPKPLEMPESKYSLLLAKGDDLRFFAWEFDDLTGTTVWYLCEWTPEHAHLNYGPRGDGSKEYFIEQTKMILEKDLKPAARTQL